MNQLFQAIKLLNGDEVIQYAPGLINETNNNLIHRLMISSIRRSITKFIEKSSDFDLLTIVQSIYSEICPFVEKILSIPQFLTLKNEISFLIFSIIKISFNFDEEFFIEKYDINEILFNPSILSAFSFCGFFLFLESSTLQLIKHQCISCIEEFSLDGPYDDPFAISALDTAFEKLHQNIAKYRSIFSNIDDSLPFLTLEIHKNVVRIRLNTIFEIVRSFPDSKPALIDLRESCSKTNSHKEIAETSKRIFSNRLLHLGAATESIVIQYISAIQAFNIIDESGGLTRTVSPPIQQFLTKRRDLLDTIINRILEDDTLSDDNISIATKPNDDDILREEADQKKDLEWSPEPLHSHIRDLESLIGDASNSDALALLLNVYGSIPLFVSQLEKELARRIDATAEFEIDNEVRAIELLKRRFGSQLFLNCEVMLKDVADSKRLAATFECSNVQPLVVSNLYWPKFPEESFVLPDFIQAEMDNYSEKFSNLKKRELQWYNKAGAVEIELSFADGSTFPITVSPIYASAILLLNDSETITVEDVETSLSISKQTAENVINFWVSANVLIYIPEGKCFAMADHKPIIAIQQDNEVETDDNEKSKRNIEDEEDIEPCVKDAEIFKNFVKSILLSRKKETTNRQQLYDKMKVFIVFPKFDRSFEQYLRILNVYIQNGFIIDNEDNITLAPDQYT